MPQRILTALVENKAGVLNRVASLFRRRRFNIESLTVGHSEKPGLSRMTIVVGAGTDMDQVFRQMYRVVEVIKIKKLDSTTAIVRDLALLNIALKKKTASGLTALIKQLGGTVVKKNSDSLTVEICGEPWEVDEFIAKVKKHGILEISRTGATAISS